MGSWIWRKELLAKALEIWPPEVLEEALGIDAPPRRPPRRRALREGRHILAVPHRLPLASEIHEVRSIRASASGEERPAAILASTIGEDGALITERCAPEEEPPVAGKSPIVPPQVRVELGPMHGLAAGRTDTSGEDTS